MKKNSEKYSFQDIIDSILTVGGFGFLISILVAMPNHITSVGIYGVYLMLLSLMTGSIGVGRLLLRKKQRKIEELEAIITPQLENSSHSHDKKPRFIHSVEADIEIRFLEALTLQKGRITLTEAVVLLRETVDKLLPIIQKLQYKGIIGTEVNENGQIIYVNI